VDNLDNKILGELLIDARKSFASIAKENQVSEDTVWKRYQKMQKEGIIVGSTIQYNYKLFGYSAAANIRLNVESQHIETVLDTLNSSPIIGPGAKVTDSLKYWPTTGEGAKGAVRLYGSPFTLTLFVVFKTIGELETAKETITKLHPIIELDTSLWVETRAVPENIINLLAPQTFSGNTSEENVDLQDRVKLDRVDLQIVDKLTADGCMSFGKLAKEVGVSTDTATRRYERLKRHNYIKPVLQIDPAKLGYQSFIVLYIELSVKSHIKEMVNALSKVPGLHDFIRLSGKFDLQVVAHVRDCTDILAIHKEVSKSPYVKRVESAFADTYHCWPPSRTPITTF
jgi:Lrp/AsnC family transcriptional regulator, regulator for asnA, asnC and gidA